MCVFTSCHGAIRLLNNQRFKMHFRPEGMKIPTSFKVDDLPPNKSAEVVMGDFLRYLFAETIKYIKETTDDGEERWKEVKDNIHFVLSHPNRWKACLSLDSVEVLYTPDWYPLRTKRDEE